MIDKNDEAGSFFSGFFWKFSEQIMSQLVTFIISIVLARLLSPNDYGLVAIINVFIILANVFVTSGLSTSLIQKKDASHVDFSTIFYANLLFSFIVYFVMFLLAPFIAKFYNNMSLSLLVRVFALTLPISAYNSIQLAYVARHMLFRKIFVSTSIAAVLSGILGIVAAWKGAGVWALIIQNLSNTIFATVLLSLQIHWRPKAEFSIRSFKGLMDYGWKVLAADFMGNFFAQLRNLIIGKFYNPSSLAYYNRGDNFPNLISNNIDNTISSVLFPVMSKHGDDTNRLKKMTRRSLRTSSYIIMPLMFGIAAVASPLIQVLLTKKWMQSVPFMQILAVSNAFSTITNTNLQVMKASGRSDTLLKIEFIKKPVYILLLLISIRYDVIVVAYTMLIYSLYAALVNMQPNKKIIGYTFKEQASDVLPSLSLSIIMFLIVWPISFASLNPLALLILQIIVGILFYVLCSILFKIEPYIYLIRYFKGKFFSRNRKGK